MQNYRRPPCGAFALFPFQSKSSHADCCDVGLFNQNLWTSTELSKDKRKSLITWSHRKQEEPPWKTSHPFEVLRRRCLWNRINTFTSSVSKTYSDNVVDAVKPNALPIRFFPLFNSVHAFLFRTQRRRRTRAPPLRSLAHNLFCNYFAWGQSNCPRPIGQPNACPTQTL